MDSRPQGSDPINGQKPSEDCAVVGFKGKINAYNPIITALRTLQHRGQESAGMAVFDGKKVTLKKGSGLVTDVFNPATDDIKGYVGVGHTRYSTAGSKNVVNAGPFVMNSSFGYITISHNGEIVNADELRDSMKKEGITFQSDSDTEVMLAELSRNISKYGLKRGFEQSMESLRGAYACAISINDRLYAVRDPNGIRPLVIGKNNDGYIVASESCAIDALEGTLIKNIEPGEVVEISDEGIRTIVSKSANRIAHCMFEYVYFSRPDSVIDGINVYAARVNMGRILAKESPVEADIVVPVPDSGRSQAIGYSMESGMPYTEGLIKNRYSERTFIMPTQSDRKAAIHLKLNPIREVIGGKKVVLVDDSIVRGNTMRFIVGLMRKYGAKEIHVRIGSPHIIAPCYFGVDMKTKDQFIARGKTDEEINREIGADSLAFLSVDGLKQAISMKNNNLCLGCLTGEYPIDISKKLAENITSY
ncbi:amidophosphoribosyltransferase [Thermoplasma volcanium]|uniref:amidophosphoribosyltransferase n=1 Tax=Thermoplasma volcanium TaxID=50339 RepID=UPI0000164D62|nr:amidophosphoribosyltransferase [Thermoplasma volcanium]